MWQKKKNTTDAMTEIYLTKYNYWTAAEKKQTTLFIYLFIYFLMAM